MNCCTPNYKKTLQYISPAHGGWGLVRVAALIPESHQLFVCPFACGRHGALGGELNGIKEQISYLYIDEADIVSGNYEDLIPEGVKELLENLPEPPKVLMIFVSCLDDLLGTDHVSLTERLTKAHPGIRFLSCHMNPISLDTKSPPPVTMQKKIYSLLRPGDTSLRAVNLIGSHEGIHPDCELYRVLRENGFCIRHIAGCRTLEEFMEMADSCLNIVLSPIALAAAREMETNLGIPYLQHTISYLPEEIEAFYRELSKRLDIAIDTKEWFLEAMEAVAETKRLVGEMAIAIDYQAVKKPLTLAAALLDWGFCVRLLLLDEIRKFEKDRHGPLAKVAGLVMVNGLGHDMVHFPKGGNYLCIGFDAAHATDSRHFVDVLTDGSWFGYHGIRSLMEGMAEAFRNERCVDRCIEEAKLII